MSALVHHRTDLSWLLWFLSFHGDVSFYDCICTKLTTSLNALKKKKEHRFDRFSLKMSPKMDTERPDETFAKMEEGKRKQKKRCRRQLRRQLWRFSSNWCPRAKFLRHDRTAWPLPARSSQSDCQRIPRVGTWDFLSQTFSRVPWVLFASIVRIFQLFATSWAAYCAELISIAQKAI